MDVRVGLVVVLLLAGNWVSEARQLEAPSVLLGEENAVGKINVCKACEEYTGVALNYLNDDNTQDEVVKALHNACSQMHNLAEQCKTLVDRYSELFFLEVSSVKPDELCQIIGLCRNGRVAALPAKTDKCDICHQAVDQVLERLNDPDTELDIIETLLKACNSVGKYKSKCKTMVFEFGPVILVDAGKFVKKLDICTTFHACKKHKAETEEMLPEGKIEMVTSS